MKLIKSLVLSSLLLTVFFIAGCEQAPTSSVEPATTGSLSKTATSAVLYLWNENANNETVNIYAVSENWTEYGVTWNNKPAVYPTIEKSFQTNVSNDWITVDITGLVNKWLNGTYANFGLLLDKPADNLEVFSSREGTYPPYLKINYSDGSETILDIADAEIDQRYPDQNFGGTDRLFTALINGYQKQSLIKFDVNYVPEETCETAYAYQPNSGTTPGTCFMDLGFGNWGWSIYLPSTGKYTFPVYAGAGQCDITKGTYVGTVDVDYSGGTVKFEYHFADGFSSSETHFYAGTTKTPFFKGKATVAPGQYKVGTGLSGGIYVIAHAVVCSSNWK